MKEFYVVGEEKDGPAYYCGWWGMYNQPLFSRNTFGARRMKRANANRVRRRLEDPNLWGGKWRLVEVQPGDIR